MSSNPTDSAPTSPTAAGTPSPEVDNAASAPASNGTQEPPYIAAPPDAGVLENDTESIRGAKNVQGNQINHFYAVEPAACAPANTPWEDELYPVPRLREPECALNADEIARYADALQGKRLLLLRHAPSRQQDAEAAMLAVLQVLRQRDSNRKVVVSDSDGTVQLSKLAHSASWRADRRGVAMYLYRSADPSASGFFSSVERVDALCDKLAQMDCLLLLTVAVPRTMHHNETELANRIALWSFNAESHSAKADVGENLTGRFEVTVASCAALLPGLPAEEFSSLVRTLAPEPAPAAPTLTAEGSATAAPSRHRRWWDGERDIVLAELGLRLQPPPQATEVGADVSDAGVFVSDPSRRGEMPSWLFDNHPFLLTEHLEALAAHYLGPTSSRRFGVGFRRWVLQLDAIGAHPLTASWFAKQAHRALNEAAPEAAMQRLAELLVDLPERRDIGPLLDSVIADVANTAAMLEADLITHLRDIGLLSGDTDGAAEHDQRPYSIGFWQKMYATNGTAALMDQTTHRQAAIFALLLGLAERSPHAVTTALGNTMLACDASHQAWQAAADLPRKRIPALSLARLMFRESQGTALRQTSSQWLAMASAVAAAYPPAAQAGQRRGGAVGAAAIAALAIGVGRWLAWDLVYCVVSLLEELPNRPWPDAVYDALLGDERRKEFGGTMASLLCATAPTQWHLAHGAATGPFVDGESMLWIYQYVALAVALRNGEDPLQVERFAGDVIAPFRQALAPPHRVELLELASDLLDQEMHLRDATESRSAHDGVTRRIKSLQIVMRQLRGRVVQAA